MLHDGVTAVPFRDSADTPAGIAVLSLSALAQRAHGNAIDPYEPMRPDFHHLIEVTGGGLVVSVDFSTQTVQPGNWIWVHPRQILQFHTDLGTADGTVVLFRSGFLDDTTNRVARIDRLPTSFTPIRSNAATRAATLLVAETEHGADLADVRVLAMRHALSVILLHLSAAEHNRSHGRADVALPISATP